MPILHVGCRRCISGRRDETAETRFTGYPKRIPWCHCFCRHFRADVADVRRRIRYGNYQWHFCRRLGCKHVFYCGSKWKCPTSWCTCRKPQNMQKNPHHQHPVKEIILCFAEKIEKLRAAGVKRPYYRSRIWFRKTLEHNYEILNKLEEFSIFQLPILVGVSRKSMIYKLLGGGPENALNGTTAVHAIALMKGANLLRVHDVKSSRRNRRIFNAMQNQWFKTRTSTYF